MDSEKLVKIYDKAVREGWVFSTERGTISLAEVWKLPLTHTRSNMVTLDTLGRDILRAKREYGEDESLLSSTSKHNSSKVQHIDDVLVLLKHIISVRETEEQAKKDRATKAAKRARLLEIKNNRSLDAEQKLSDEAIDELLKDLED